MLISGEYVVLDGAIALAVPTRFGQSLNIETINYPKLIWKSFDEQGRIWFEDEFSIDNLESELSKKKNDVALRLVQILKSAKNLNPSFLNSNFRITSYNVCYTKLLRINPKIFCQLMSIITLVCQFRFIIRV